MQRRAAGLRRGSGRGVERGLEVTGETGDGLCVRPRLAGRRHEPDVELVDDLFPNLGVGSRVRDIRVLERQSGFLLGRTVTLRAIALDDGAVVGGEPLRRARARRKRDERTQRRAATNDALQLALHQRAAVAGPFSGTILPSRAPSARSASAAGGLDGGMPKNTGERPSA